jgi:Lrp/AsnC family transcriptional regulator, regulator for asnA, asnC and gidA
LRNGLAGGMGETKKRVTPARRDAGAAAPPASGESNRGAALDHIDLAIVRALQADGRAPFTTIAKQLDISEGAVRNRVGQLIASKVLRVIGVANPVALGYDAYAMVGLKVSPGQDPQKLALYFHDRDEVTYVLFAAGRYDLLIEVICETQKQLALFLREHCYARPDLASVEPMIGLAMYKSMLKWGQPE